MSWSGGRSGKNGVSTVEGATAQELIQRTIPITLFTITNSMSFARSVPGTPYIIIVCSENRIQSIG